MTTGNKWDNTEYYDRNIEYNEKIVVKVKFSTVTNQYRSGTRTTGRIILEDWVKQEKTGWKIILITNKQISNNWNALDLCLECETIKRMLEERKTVSNKKKNTTISGKKEFKNARKLKTINKQERKILSLGKKAK